MLGHTRSASPIPASAAPPPGASPSVYMTGSSRAGRAVPSPAPRSIRGACRSLRELGDVARRRFRRRRRAALIAFDDGHGGKCNAASVIRSGVAPRAPRNPLGETHANLASPRSATLCSREEPRAWSVVSFRRATRRSARCAGAKPACHGTRRRSRLSRREARRRNAPQLRRLSFRRRCGSLAACS